MKSSNAVRLLLAIAAMSAGPAMSARAATDRLASPHGNADSSATASTAGDRALFERMLKPGGGGVNAWLVSTGTDGHSHLRRVSFPGTGTKFDAGNGVAAVPGMDNRVISYFSHKLAEVTLYTSLGAVERKPHVAPGCEMFLILAGKTTYVGTDGKTQDFGPGDLIIFEDTTGTGHSTRSGPNGYTAIGFSFVVQNPISAETR